MAIGINDLDFEEDDYGIIPPSSQEGNDNPKDLDGDEIKPWMENPYLQENNPKDGEEPKNNIPQEEEKDIITLLLRERNIQDPSKIKFEDEEGNIQERDWNSLTTEEQLNILKTSNDDTESQLEDDEIDLINKLRLSQMSPEEFINYVKQQGVSEYLQYNQEEPVYKIDDLSDEDLFILDLQSRVEDITDEEATAALDRAKQDQSLFEKQMKGIREEYKRIESEKQQMQDFEKQQEEAQRFETFKNSVLESIQSFDKIGSLDIDMEDDDMNEIANFILSSDSAGVNYLAKALNDPQTLVRMAWFALKGEEAIDSITEYFTEEIKKVSQSRYEQGFKDGKSGKKEKTSPVIIKPTQEKKPTTPTIGTPNKQLSIDDLD